MKNLIKMIGQIVLAIILLLIPAKTRTIDPNISTSAFIDHRAAIVDEYFVTHKMPLAGYGEKLVMAADKNDLDWRLLPAIAIRESSGGLHACGANPFGWNSCNSTFASVDDAIEAVAANLGGNVTSTSEYYKGKSTIAILHAYNPESIVSGYASSVIEIMGDIDVTIK